MSTYSWKPIERLAEKDFSVDQAALRPLYATWRASKERLQESSPAGLKEFNQRLVRRLSVETGILERLYDLDRGTTEALVANGFVEELVSRSSTDIEPSRLIDILRDQEAAIQLVIDCVASKRGLTKSVVHELHATITKNQDTTTAVDQLGNRFEIKLLKGKFKEQPNNPKRPDGTFHEYCPPIHVDSEMENLLTWLAENDNEDPVLVAAWLHHRFTQIHPYQDGNGRIARALTTLVLLRADLLPLVIDRDLRVEYITALESADQGDLSQLVSVFARLEQGAILQALSVDADAEISHQKTLTNAVIDSLAEKFGKRRQAKHEALRGVNNVALTLRARARTILEDAYNKLEGLVSESDNPDIHFTDGGPERANMHWYKFEVVKSANEKEKFVNFAENHYFIKAAMRVGRERLVFVTSFHHVGRELSGVMEAIAFSQLESYEDSDDRKSVSQAFFVCSLEPVVFTYQTNPDDIGETFTRWLDSALAIALKEYGDRL